MKTCTCTAVCVDPGCPVGVVVGRHAPGPTPDDRRRLPDRRRPRWQVFDQPIPLSVLHQHLGVGLDELPAGLLLLVRIAVDEDGAPARREDGGGKTVDRVLLVGSMNAIGGLCGECACAGEVLAISHDLVSLVCSLGVPPAGVSGGQLGCDGHGDLVGHEHAQS